VSDHGTLTALLLLVLLTVIGPVLAVRIRVPTAVVLIIAGIVVGPAGLDLLDDTGAVSLLSELGFLVLMFVAGMEIDFESLRGAGLKRLFIPSLSVAAFFAAAIAAALFRHMSMIELLVISASSVGMPLAILQETKRLQTPVGRHVLLTASIGEFVSILAITGYELLAEDAPGWHRALRVAKVLLLFVLSAAIIRWARAAVWWRPEPFRRLTQHHDVAELGVRTGLLVMFAFVVIAAMLGVEAILGAFIAGALVAFVLREKHALESKIAALGQGLFVPIFFIVVGVRFDPRLLDYAAVRNAMILVVVVGCVKIGPCLVFGSRELGLRERLAAGALLSAPLTLVVAIGVIGKRLGAVDDRKQASFLLLAMILSVGFPILFRALLPSPAEDAAAGPKGEVPR
jgi:Kef-type K+ transport system membrane component KefB